MSADNEWQDEMQSMLKIFENQSEKSLRKINRCFDVLHRSFSDFREMFMKASTQRYQSRSLAWIFVSRLNIAKILPPLVWSFHFRLALSFTKIEMERWSKIQVISGLNDQNAKRKHQHPKIESDASPSTSTCRGNAIQIHLRKCSNEISVKFIWATCPLIFFSKESALCA